MQDEFKMTETVEKLQTVYYFGRQITQEPLYLSGIDYMQFIFQKWEFDHFWVLKINFLPVPDKLWFTLQCIVCCCLYPEWHTCAGTDGFFANNMSQ